MAANFIPHICGNNSIYVPESGCTDCEKLEKRVAELEDTRLVQSDILAGEHIEVEYATDSNNVTIKADLSDYYTKSEVYNTEQTYTKTDVDELISAISTSHFEVVDALPETGAGNVIYLLKDGNAYNQYIYTDDDGWVMIGTTSVTLDKQSILNALGYEETTISMTDTDGNTVTRTVLMAMES